MYAWSFQKVETKRLQILAQKIKMDESLVKCPGLLVVLKHETSLLTQFFQSHPNSTALLLDCGGMGCILQPAWLWIKCTAV